MKYNLFDVAITQNDNENQAVLEGLKLIDAEKLFTNEDTVLLIPNFVNASKPHPSSGITVGNDTLKTIIQFVKQLHPKKIIVASGSGGGNTLDVIKKIGYDEVFKSEKVEFIDFNTGPYDHLTIHHSIIHSLKVNKILTEATKIISFTQLKQHEESTMSAAIKNVMMSIPSTEEHGTPKKNTGIHEDLHGFIAKMALKVKIDLSIVSAHPAMVGTGPTNGIAIHSGLVICGNNPVSTDTICARLLGFKPQAINYLYQLKQAKVLETDTNKINIKGLSLNEAEVLFAQKVYHSHFSVD